MAPKNKKAQKVLLTDFLADTSTGRSWADEMDELPTAPAPRDPNEPAQGGLGGSHLSRHDGNRYGDRDSNRRGGDREGYERPPRPDLPIPDKPPYNAFVGNLSWEVGQTDLEEFFGAAHIVSIRMITDHATGKPKGYGYIEFDDREALIAAIDRSGREVGGRPVRVSVAEPPKEREDRTGGTWRREGPLPSFDDNRRTRHSSHQEYSSTNDTDRGERMGFGSKFVPSTDTAVHMTRRTQSGRGFSRAEGSSVVESDVHDRGERMGFGSKYVPSVSEPKKDREPPLRGSNFIPSRPTPVGSDDGQAGSGPSFRKPASIERKPTETEADSVSTWRRAKPVIPTESEASPSAPPAAPPTRRKLELAARTVTSTEEASTPPTSVATNKPSPFGAAKPVDSTEREKAIQEKLDRDRAQPANSHVKTPASTLDEKPGSEVDPKGASAAVTSSLPTSAAAPKVPKPNPFGEAKPVDTLQKEAEVEKKLEREKALLEEKLKKEAEAAKTAPSIGAKHPVSTSSTTGPASLTKTSAKPPTSATGSQASQPPSAWRTPSVPASKQAVPASKQSIPASKPSSPPSKPAANGHTVPPSSVTVSTAPPPATKGSASPKSPNLSSFRKEGISFAALAKTAAVNSHPTSAASPSAKPSTKEEQRTKSTAQQPKTILKRAEGLEIQKE